MQLPPVYRPRASSAPDVFAAALSAAAAGAEPGTLLWRDDGRRLDWALVLAPDRPLAGTRLAARAGQLALADTLASLAPPSRPIAVRGETLLCDGAEVAALRFGAQQVADPAVPGWACLGVSLELAGDPADDAPGRHPERTSLREEGFDCGGEAVIEGFARHFLSWLDRWEAEGDAVLRESVR